MELKSYMDKPKYDLTGDTKPAPDLRQASNQLPDYSFESILKRSLTESNLDPGVLGLVGVMSQSYLTNNTSPTSEGLKVFIYAQLDSARKNFQSRIEAGQIPDTRGAITAAAFSIAESFLTALNEEKVTFNPT
jgi:hypothetical protein